MRLTFALCLLALALWLAAAVAPGAAAVSAFRVIPTLGVSIPALDGYFGGDSVDAGRYVAGRMLQPLFDATDWVQISAAALTASTLFRLWRLGHLKGPTWLRALAMAAVVAAGALFGVRLAMGGHMRTELLAYWSAIDAADRPAAELAKASFDADHRLAERLSSAQLAALLAAIGLVAAAAIPGESRAPITRTATAPHDADARAAPGSA
jgi:hypothetical protein